MSDRYLSIAARFIKFMHIVVNTNKYIDRRKQNCCNSKYKKRILGVLLQPMSLQRRICGIQVERYPKDSLLLVLLWNIKFNSNNRKRRILWNKWEIDRGQCEFVLHVNSTSSIRSSWVFFAVLSTTFFVQCSIHAYRLNHSTL